MKIIPKISAIISYVYTVYGHVVEIDRHNDINQVLKSFMSSFYHLHHHKFKYVFAFLDSLDISF